MRRASRKTSEQDQVRDCQAVMKQGVTRTRYNGPALNGRPGDRSKIYKDRSARPVQCSVGLFRWPSRRGFVGGSYGKTQIASKLALFLGEGQKVLANKLRRWPVVVSHSLPNDTVHQFVQCLETFNHLGGHQMFI